MSKKRFRPCICLILQQSCCLCSKSCYWIIGSCRYFSKVVSELSVLLTSWILVRGDPFLKVQFQFGAEPDNKKVKRLATPLHSLNRHNGLCIDRLRPVHRPCGKQVCLYRQCVGSNSLISFPSMARLSNPFKWTSANVFQQGIYPFQCFSVLSLPWQVFFKRLFRECDISPHRPAAPTRP